MLRRIISKRKSQIETIVDHQMLIAHQNTRQDRRLSAEQKTIVALDINAEGFEKLIFGFIRQIIYNTNILFPIEIVRLCIAFFNCGFENLIFNIFNKNISQTLYGKIIKSHPASENIKCHRLFLSDIGYNVGIHKWKIKLFISGNSMQGGIGICSNISSIISNNNTKTLQLMNNNSNSNHSSSAGSDSIHVSNNRNSHRFEHSYEQEICDTKNFRKQPWITHGMLGTVYYWCRNMKRIYTFNGGKGRTVDTCEKTYKSGDVITVILDCNLWTLKFLLNDENICSNSHGITIKKDVRYYPVVAIYHWVDTFRVITK